MANKIEIIIKARNDTAGTLDELKADSYKAGVEAGEAYKDGFKEAEGKLKSDPEMKDSAAKLGDDLGEQIHEHVTEKISEVKDDPKIKESGKGIGAELGDGLKDELQKRFDAFARGDLHETEKIKVKFDWQKDTLAKDFKEAFSNTKQGIADTFHEVFSSAGLFQIGPWIAGAVIAGAPIIGGAISSVFALALGGGAIGLGLAGAFKSAQVQKALTAFKKDMSGILSDFTGNNFQPALLTFFRGTEKMFGSMRTDIEALGASLGHLSTSLAQGVVGFLHGLIVPTITAIKQSAPVIAVLAEDLPAIGTALGNFFKKITSDGPATAIFFDDLLTAIIGIISTLGDLTLALTKTYLAGKHAALELASAFINAFYNIISVAASAFSWIPGLGPKLVNAAAKVGAFKNRVNAELSAIHDREITITIRTVFSGVANAAVGIAALLHGGKASGGIIGGSANGATPSGLTWVGENGPELISAPAGSRVYSNGDSHRLAGMSGGNMGVIVANLHVDGHRMASVMLDPQRKIVRQLYGGSVQAAYGVGA